jgi:hypothetical protein
MKKKLPRGIHRLPDSRYWCYTTRRGRPVRQIVSWELLKKLKVPVEPAARSLNPGLQLAKLALTRLQNSRLEERRSGAIDASAKVKISGLLPLMEADYLHQGFRSWDDAEARWKNHLQKPFGDRLASEITTDALNAYVAKRLREEAEPGSVNRELSVLRRMLKLAHVAGKVQNVVAFPHLKETNIRQGFLEQREYDLLAAHAHPVGIRGLLCVGYSYGFRRGELLSLCVRQVDLVNGTIWLERSQTKNDRVKVVCMTSEVKNVLALCVAGKEPDGRVFTWADGRPIRDFPLLNIFIARQCSTSRNRSSATILVTFGAEVFFDYAIERESASRSGWGTLVSVRLFTRQDPRLSNAQYWAEVEAYAITFHGESPLNLPPRMLRGDFGPIHEEV